MTDLTSTAPVLYSALFNLITQAAYQQSPPVTVAPFELIQYEPANYIILQGIDQHRMEIESLGPNLQMLEYYQIFGFATVFVGDSPDVFHYQTALDVMTQTYALFNSCVSTPAATYNYAPVWQATSPLFPDGAVNYALPTRMEYSSGPGGEDGAPVGWMGRIDFAYQLRALVQPQ